MSEIRALITGITGQDGSYMAERLLEEGYKVYGLQRRTSSPMLDNIKHIVDKIELVDGDLTDQGSLYRAITSIRPQQVYNLGAQTFVAASFDQPVITADVTGLGPLRMLEAIRESGMNIRFVQASSSEQFGKVIETPQTEKTPFYPRSPYGVSKVFAYHIVKNYAESYNIFAANAIMFNHESPRRPTCFVTRKITDGIAKIVAGKSKFIELGNLDAKRDWSFAGDMMDGLFKIMHHKEPDTFVLSSGETHSIQEFLEIAFEVAGLGDYHSYIRVNPKFIRPAEVDVLQGDSTKARKTLGWKPKVAFRDLVTMMVKSDLEKK